MATETGNTGTEPRGFGEHTRSLSGEYAHEHDPIPTPENGSHEKSHAAHLGKVHEKTKPADKLRQGMVSSELREPPTVVQRVGKQHR